MSFIRIQTVLNIVFIVIGALSVMACASDKALSEKLSLSGMNPLPEDAYGAVYIDSPTTGSLLHLRGTVGNGVMLLRNSQSEYCSIKAVKFAAGDFEGKDISVTQADDVRLIIYNQEIARHLLSGGEVVSEDIVITNSLSQTVGDIHVHSGIELTQGFVLNPSEWFLASLFDSDDDQLDCTEKRIY
ncbi:hypothetical protein [Marinomonas sp. 2405UD68-3]|uniref:hypothetical protein n=1 Tax=Marinomonas sp. 2405UD68-3 TaxID=3391835 RepID=UPI0039C9BACC